MTGRAKDRTATRRIVEFLENCGIPIIEDAFSEFIAGASTEAKSIIADGLVKALAEPHDASILDDDQTYRNRIVAHFDDNGEVADWVYKVVDLASGALLDEIGDSYWVFRDHRTRP